MDGVVEIITGRERRRRGSLEDKLRLVAEMEESGVRVWAVTAYHDAAFIVRLLFKYLQTLEVRFVVRCETGEFAA